MGIKMMLPIPTGIPQPIPIKGVFLRHGENGGYLEIFKTHGRHNARKKPVAWN
jgi:hypothetical protein